MQCPFCETELSDTAIVCKGCGAEKKGKTSGYKYEIGCIFLLFYIFFIIFTVFSTYYITNSKVIAGFSILLPIIIMSIHMDFKKKPDPITEYTWHRETILKNIDR